ncbi:uncharacterized protein J3D65DRAFT_626252 [Phyllosticta citribraziliensis]|uniref:Septation initiation network scaffold protein cdc11 n=1 Tax=Phyllosticta citribraziliensis TaxID=989973 RepID=A0ABR1LM26_9PEZI
MAQPWLDDLSEDWLPQPASSPPSRRDSSAAKSSFDSNPPSSRSRIPRLKSSPAPAALHTPNTEPVARQLPGKRKNVLAERSKSDNNILNNHPATSPARPNESRVPSHPRSISTSSADSVVRNGTVEIKSAAPLQTKRPHDTPEWKRRLIHGRMGYGDQKDLFSPMGLENIFQQPAPAPSSSPDRKKGRLSMLKDSVVMPSSPPPWPSQISQSSPSKPSSRDYDALEEDSMQSVAERPESEDGSVVQTRNPPKLQPIHEHSSLSMKDRSRVTSGQTELTDDSFSPVYISRRNTKDGGIEYQPLDLSKSELERVKNQSEKTDPAAFNESLNSNGNTDISTFSKLRSETLPDDLPTGTPDHLNVGQFVNLKRGGFSADGSFRERPLSPSPLKGGTSDPNDPARQEDSQATVPMFEGPAMHIRRQIPRSSSPPLSPKTPARRQPNLDSDRPRSSGSPLKLFGDHDTFTANRLFRRMSQLEDALPTTANSSRPSSSESPEKRLEAWLPSVEEGFHESDDNEEQFRTSNGSYFGRGELDHHRFPEEEFSSSRNSTSYDDDVAASRPILPEFKFNLIDGNVHQSSVNKRKLSRHTVKSGATTMTNKSSIKIPKSPRLSPNQLFPALSSSHLPPDSEASEGKRPPTSPFKNPQPKRRRTLLSSELGDADYYSYDKLQLALEDPHEDALSSQYALRPRNPTPSESRLEQVQRQVLNATDAYLHNSPKALHVIQEHVESPSSRRLSEEREHERAIAREVATFTVRMNQRMRDEDRKRSVTTQDFLDQARLIMDHIRTRGRPNSALESLAESEQSPLRERSTFLQVPESPLSFSRPPSREGPKDGWSNPSAPRTSDARVVSHLKKFQETDGEDFMMASFRSNNLRHYEDRTSEESRFHDGQSPDIRILTRNLTMQRRRDRSHSDGSPPGTKSSQSPRSRRSTLDSSLGRTNVTGISRRSENVANLAPGAVAHLIPQELAGMTFDREKGIWVRRNAKSQRSNLDVSNITTSDDDPLKNIPDLTVDEVNEKRQAEYPPSMFEEANEFLQSYREKDAPSRQASGERPQTREGAEIPVSDTNSAKSKFSVNLSSSAMQPDTRATSVSDKHGHGGLKPVAREETIPEVPSSINRSSIHESFQKELRKLSGKSFDRKGASFRQKSFDEDKTIELPYLGNYQTEDQDEATPLKRDWATPHPRFNNFRSVTKETVTDHSPTPPRQTHADLSLIHRAEMYSEQGNSPLRFSVSITRPLKTSVSKPHGSSVGSNAVGPYSPKAGTAYTTFLLSELPEFTLNQIDEKELPNRLVKKVAAGEKQALSVLEDRFAQGTLELVKALQDEAPEELFWEDLRTVGLRNKDLPTLHRLDELCTKVENLDVSNNHIAQLTGAPPSIRRLNIQNNCVTSLTGWGHLVNLQYLDVSGNALDSLIGFKGLVHLREIQADGNQIEDLDGVLGLDALIKLSVKNNKIRRVDLRGCALDTLVELDLGGNAIKSIRGLEELPFLERLGLDDNQLVQFPTHTLTAKAHRLRNLSLNRNRLMTLSLSRFPSLVSVSCDSNHLPSIPELNTLRHLRILSARDQQPTSPFNANAFFSNPDLNELYLSANSISHFTLPADVSLLNLHRLELANCGLVALPERFGLLAPNVRILNLNANAMRDLRPLLNMKKLRKLEVAGNRLQRLRRNVLVLSKLGSSLKTVDMRNNPFNVGFYAQPLLASTLAAASTAALAQSKVRASKDNGSALPRLLTAPPPASAPGSFTSAAGGGVASPTFSPLSFPSTVTSSFVSHPADDSDDETPTQADDADPFTSSQRFYASPHPANLHSLPPQPAALDANYRVRLDADTALRRRVYEMLVAHACEGVKKLDGLSFDRTRVLGAASGKGGGKARAEDDGVWARLIEVGVVRRKEKGKNVAGTSASAGGHGAPAAAAAAGTSMRSFESVD